MNKYTIIPPKSIINRENYLFIYTLLKSIFIFDSQNFKKKSKKLELFIKKIKEKYNISLKREYSKENFENIIKYVKIQNKIYGGEILENILLTIFTSVMKIPQKDLINKYIYLNLCLIYDIKNKSEEKQKEEIDNIRNFMMYDKLYPEELKNKEVFFQTYKAIPTILEYFIIIIYKFKLDSIKYSYKKREKTYNDTSYNLYQNALKNVKNQQEKNMIENSMIEFNNKINKIYYNYINNNMPVNSSTIIPFFFFTLFTNYQTINSRLINFNTKSNSNMKYANVEFDYNLTGGLIKGYNAILVCSPMRQDNRIKKISLGENNLGELGMFEIGKTIIFNPNIKILNYNNNKLYSYHFYYLKKAIKIFNNDTIEEINLSYNNFKNDIDDYLCIILKKFKNLKRINLSNNNIGSGLSKFFSCLKLLYRKKKTKLEKININKCRIDKFALYELAECLKSKYCKLKCLYLNLNNINDYNAGILFNSIKKNNSLKKIYLCGNMIGNSSTEKICKIISKMNNSIETIYLNKNQIKNNDNLLRIMSRTKIIYEINEYKNKNKFIINLNNNQILKNLDISCNNVYIKNKNQLLVFKDIINNTYLACIDYSLILKDFAHHEIFEKKHYEEYNKELNALNNNLNLMKNKRSRLFDYLDEINNIHNKYRAIFDKYINNKNLINILSQSINNNSNMIISNENIENVLSYELLEIFGKTKEELNDNNNYYLIINIIKYIILYKINGGYIKNLLQGINKCLVIL